MNEFADAAIQFRINTVNLNQKTSLHHNIGNILIKTPLNNPLCPVEFLLKAIEIKMTKIGPRTRHTRVLIDLRRKTKTYLVGSIHAEDE